MGYSRNPQTISRRLHLLTGLIQGESEVVWRSTIRNAPTLAVHIRECFYIARMYPHLFKRLADASREYTICVRDDKVFAIRATEQPIVLEDLPTLHVQPPKAVHAARSSDVIQMWLDQYPSETPIFFTSSMPDSDRQELETWVANIQPAWTLTYHTDQPNVLKPKGVSQ